ncbi:MAG: ankyrin repeat domain-containing protein [Polyangiaceae bacterium]
MNSAAHDPASPEAALELAAVNGDRDAVVKLLAAGTRAAPEVLVHAITAGRAEIVDLLLDAGADPNALDEHGVAPVFVAAAFGHPAVHAFLADPDRTDIRAPGWPAHTLEVGHGEIIWTLMARGVDPNARYSPSERHTVRGVSVLMVAAAFGNTGAIDVLVARGADPRATDYAGRTARDFAEHFGQKPAMERLRTFVRR